MAQPLAEAGRRSKILWKIPTVDSSARRNEWDAGVHRAYTPNEMFAPGRVKNGSSHAAGPVSMRQRQKNITVNELICAVFIF